MRLVPVSSLRRVRSGKSVFLALVSHTCHLRFYYHLNLDTSSAQKSHRAVIRRTVILKRMEKQG